MKVVLLFFFARKISQKAGRKSFLAYKRSGWGDCADVSFSAWKIWHFCSSSIDDGLHAILTQHPDTPSSPSINISSLSNTSSSLRKADSSELLTLNEGSRNFAFVLSSLRWNGDKAPLHAVATCNVLWTVSSEWSYLMTLAVLITQTG